jgi:hypothetical protein
MRNNVKNTFKTTCGIAEPTLDTFTDVKRALHKWLMANDPKYLKASQDATIQSQNRKLALQNR